MLALPIFTARHQATIVGVSELNFCVRDGNRWTLTAINTNYMRAFARFILNDLTSINNQNGDPYEIRTRVAGVRGRSLRPLDQRATIGTPSRARTVDTLIKSQVLYQLS